MIYDALFQMLRKLLAFSTSTHLSDNSRLSPQCTLAGTGNVWKHAQLCLYQLNATT
jgi:hypothetical protein